MPDLANLLAKKVLSPSGFYCEYEMFHSMKPTVSA